MIEEKRRREEEYRGRSERRKEEKRRGVEVVVSRGKRAYIMYGETLLPTSCSNYMCSWKELDQLISLTLTSLEMYTRRSLSAAHASAHVPICNMLFFISISNCGDFSLGEISIFIISSNRSRSISFT